ncbi:unnamed protein product, partial [Durusdinium trenchii]
AHKIEVIWSVMHPDWQRNAIGMHYWTCGQDCTPALEMQAAMLPKEIGSLKEMELVCWKAFNAFCELHSPQDLKLFKLFEANMKKPETKAKPKPPTESKHDMAKGEMDVGPAKSESEKGNDAAIVVDPGKPELEVGDDNKGANKHKDDQEEADQNDNQEAQQEEQKEDTAIQEGKDKAAAEKGDKAAVEKGDKAADEKGDEPKSSSSAVATAPVIEKLHDV